MAVGLQVEWGEQLPRSPPYRAPLPTVTTGLANPSLTCHHMHGLLSFPPHLGRVQTPASTT